MGLGDLIGDTLRELGADRERAREQRRMARVEARAELRAEVAPVKRGYPQLETFATRDGGTRQLWVAEDGTTHRRRAGALAA